MDQKIGLTPNARNRSIRLWVRMYKAFPDFGSIIGKR